MTPIEQAMWVDLLASVWMEGVSAGNESLRYPKLADRLRACPYMYAPGLLALVRDAWERGVAAAAAGLRVIVPIRLAGQEK